MPPLSNEPTLYPTLLFDNLHDFGQGRRWWVLHTKPRQEKAVARALYRSAVPYFLPTLAKRKRLDQRGRVTISYLPLFSGYVFFLGNDDERSVAVRTNRLAGVLQVHEQELMAFELAQVHRLLESSQLVFPEDSLQVGQRVRIRAGAFEGLEGTLARRQSGLFFIVHVTWMGAGASVKIGEESLDPIS